MGQRHQYWIIAKVNGRYRTIAVVHHQWAYRRLPPRACWRLLQILGHSANKKLLAHELNYAATLTESFWDDPAFDPYDETDIAKTIPFPFAATCLVLAASFDPRPETSYYHGVAVLSTRTDFTQTDNNDGFTIVDITNLDDMRFCFLFPFEQFRDEDDPGNKSTRPPPFTPLTAEEYVTEYSEVKVDVDLSCWGLINADMLRDLWPHGPWLDRNDNGCGGKHIERAARITSLKELAFPEAIEQYRYYPDLGMVEQLPDFSSCLRKWVHKFPESIKAPHGLRILGRSMKDAQHLDLSAFHWLPEEVIVQLVKENADVDIVDSVDLSTNTTITVDGIKKLLQICPNITKLITLHTPRLSMDALVEAIAGSNVDELFHAELFRSFHGGKQPTYVTRSESVTQIVYLSISNSTKADNSCYFDQGGLKWNKLAKDRFKSWNGPFAACIPLCDGFLPFSRATKWLDQLLNFFGFHCECYRMYKGEDIPKACAQAIALDLRDTWKVGPIPAEAYFLNRGVKELKAGEWTLLVVVEEKKGEGYYGECETLRYAFATRDGTGQVLTVDINYFSSRPAQLPAPSQMKPRKGTFPTTDWSKVTVLGEKEVADVMELVMDRLS